MLLQTVYDSVRRLEKEQENLKAAHEEELKAKDLQIEALKTQVFLFQMLVGGAPKTETAVPDDEYSV